MDSANRFRGNLDLLRRSITGVALLLLLCLCYSVGSAQVESRPELPKNDGKPNKGKGLDEVESSKPKPTTPTPSTNNSTGHGKALETVAPKANTTNEATRPPVGAGGGKALDFVLAKTAAPPKLKLFENSQPTYKPRPSAPKPRATEPVKPAEPRVTGPDFPELVTVPSGQFKMGASGDDSPVHNVEVSAFAVSKMPITNWQFNLFVENTGYQTEAEVSPTDYEREHGNICWRSFAAGRENYPVVWLTWKDAVAYCEWLTRVMVMLDPKRVDPLLEEQADGSISVRVENPYRLPSEAEWEYAARGGTDQNYPWGNQADQSSLNCNWDTRPDTVEAARKFIQPVGYHAANSYGLFDMAGNIGQWCYDWYAPDYYRQSPGDDPFGPENGEQRVVRGGSWYAPPEACRVNARQHVAPNQRNAFLGFRIARTLSEN